MTEKTKACIECRFCIANEHEFHGIFWWKKEKKPVFNLYTRCGVNLEYCSITRIRDCRDGKWWEPRE